MEDLVHLDSAHQFFSCVPFLHQISKPAKEQKNNWRPIFSGKFPPRLRNKKVEIDIPAKMRLIAWTKTSVCLLSFIQKQRLQASGKDEIYWYNDSLPFGGMVNISKKSKEEMK